MAFELLMHGNQPPRVDDQLPHFSQPKLLQNEAEHIDNDFLVEHPLLHVIIVLLGLPIVLCVLAIHHLLYRPHLLFKVGADDCPRAEGARPSDQQAHSDREGACLSQRNGSVDCLA